MVHNLGLLLTQVINNNSSQNKATLLTSIHNFKTKQQLEQEKLIKNRDYYHTNFILKRLENDTNYNEYIHNRSLLFKEWQRNKSLANLDKLMNYKLPQINLVPDIYTYNIKKNYHHHIK
jgi:hypothetical protein